MLENSKFPVGQRDPRLDFFRGLAMFIIFVSHTPGNWWVNWIPARFGFSDATEIFVFCSGMASAIAFGRIFEMQGMAMGSARILFRVWQVYWAHIALFFMIVALNIGFDRLLDPVNAPFTGSLNLHVFFENIRAGIFGLLTLTYVPNYFDILPMYLGILLIVPAVVWLRGQHPYAPFVFCALLWLAAYQRFLDLPADPWTTRTWFFNPFSWQLLFFTGFALMRGWLPTPPIRKSWMIVCGIVLLACFPFSTHRMLSGFSGLQEITGSLWPLNDKTTFGPLRYMHFLALAYLAYAGVTLLGARFSGPVVDITRKVGQQSLGVFLASLVLAQCSGVALNLIGANYLTSLLVTIIGFFGLIAVAQTVAWYKTTPWKQPNRVSRHGLATPAEAQTKERNSSRDADASMREPILPVEISPAE